MSKFHMTNLQNTSASLLLLKGIAILCAMLILSCSSNKNFYSIDPGIIRLIELNKEADETFFEDLGQSYFMAVDEIDLSEGEILDDLVSFMFKNDTSSLLVPNVIGCELRNDTINIMGGIFYVGGTGYMIQIHRNGMVSKIVIAGEEKYKIDPEGEYIEELYLNSKSQKLTLAEDLKFELGTRLKGKVEMESEIYYQLWRGKMHQNRMKMQILFDCPLEEKVAF